MKRLISYGRAQKRILRAIESLPPEKLPLSDIIGLALAEDIVADRDLPPFHRAAMDGFAVIAADTDPAPTTLKIVGEVVPGSEADFAVERGQAARIMTGAPLPEGADAVVVVEVCEEEGDSVEIGETVGLWKNIARKGEDAEAGTALTQAGAEVTPSLVALLASVGKTKVLVHRHPRVAMAVTGGEVVDPGKKPSSAQIRDANGPALAARLTAAGAEISSSLRIGDDKAEIEHAVDAMNDADLLIFSGGLSKGRYDFVKDVLEARGAEFDFAGITMKPGKPTAFAKLDGKPVFALPGNPVSCLVTAELFVVPALRRMMGNERVLPVEFRVELRGDIAADSSRTLFYPVKMAWNFGVPSAYPLPYHGSGDFADFARAEALAIIPPDPEGGGQRDHDIVDAIMLGQTWGRINEF